MIAVRYVNVDGRPRPPAGLSRWRDTFAACIEATAAVGRFLVDDLALALSTEPATRVGLALTAATDLSELVDLTSTSRVAGTTVSPWFRATAVAGPSGAPAEDVADSWLTTLCDDALHLDEDYEPTAADQHMLDKNRPPLDLRDARGVQIGDHNVQINSF